MKTVQPSKTLTSSDFSPSIFPTSEALPIKPSTHRLVLHPNSQEGALGISSLTLQNNVHQHLSGSIFSGISWSFSPFNSQKRLLIPYISFYNKQYNILVKPGIQISPNNSALFFVSERKTVSSHFSLFTRFGSTPKLKLFFTNHKFGGPLFRFQNNRASLGYLHSVDLSDDLNLSFKTEVDQHRPYFGLSSALTLNHSNQTCIYHSVIL